MLAAGVLLSSAVVVASCGGDDDDDDATATPSIGDATMATGDGATFTAGDIEVSNVRARASETETSAVYMNIESSGEADRLLSASIAASVADEVQVHETVADGATVKMQELADGLPIPADGLVELKTGGYHVMVLGLVEPLKAGGEITVTLTFEKAGNLEIKAPVMEIASGMSASN